MKTIFEPMAEHHCAEVMAIFNYYVEHGFSAYPETRLPDVFFGKFLELTRGYPAFVIKDQVSGEIAGFCFLRAWNPFSTFKKTAELSCFIAPGHTGKGLGTAALNELECQAKPKGIKVLLAGISSKNTQSLAFHRKHGFTECGRFKNVGEKNGTVFDVVWMQKEL